MVTIHLAKLKLEVVGDKQIMIALLEEVTVAGRGNYHGDSWSLRRLQRHFCFFASALRSSAAPSSAARSSVVIVQVIITACPVRSSSCSKIIT